MAERGDMSEKEESQQETTSHPSVFQSRRRFIQLGAAALGAAWAGTLVQSKLFPVQSSAQEATPVEFPLSELPVGGSKSITYGGSPVLVLRTPESIKAFSLICTHLGCVVEWQDVNMEFYCPCHDGRFDQFGEVIAGPPPIPLEQFPVQVEDDKVIVGEVI
jgi:cytochrome b6-f complex iron-sulfur subunit